MPAVLERLGRALAPEILVERELASGGMGIVFLARDTVLDRPIAIKVLRPELASAVAAERFLREGRAAARLSHPNVVRVHRAGIADGLHYFAMDLVVGETLADRLERGPLPAADTAALGRDLLAALAAAHDAQLIHRDVKPSNVFLEDGRALLGDFGIARAVESDDTTLTGPGQPIGTLAYMAPEQLMGAPATARTDLYATGMVLFEASTGRGWNAMYAPEKAEWSDVPRWLRRPLQRALQPKPDDRWDTASSFAAALDRRRPWPLLLGVAAVLLAAIGYLVRPEARPPNDVVVFPFATDRLADSALGRDLTGMTRWYFERLPDLRVLPAKAAARAWAESPLPQGRRFAALTSTTRSRFGVWGIVHPRGPRLEVEIHVVNARGEPVLQAVEQGDSADRIGLADRIGGRIIGVLSPELTPAYRSAPAVARVAPGAVLEFLQGEEAFARDAWLTAERHYARALALDSGFVLAAWRLGNTRRWMPLRPTPPFGAGFLPLFHAHGGALPEIDRRLVEAQFAPSGAVRFARYDEARRLGRGDAYASLLYGDELFHRGPLAGRPLEEAAAMLAGAAEADPTLAPAWEHLAWALIRLGRRDEARRALDSLDRVAGRPEESEIYLPAFLRLAFTARFDPAAVPNGGGQLLDSPAALALAARGALAFDLPEFELAFGQALAALEGAPAPLRASGWTAQGVALVALGRPAEALAQFDSAAGLFADSTEARLQAAEWRVVPAALGVEGFPVEETDLGRRALRERAAGATGGAPRARWALALDAFARGDTVEGRWWQRELARAEPSGGPLGQLVAGQAAAARGDRAAALRLSEPALARDSAGYAPDPFFRAALHLLRGEWLAAAGRARDADRAWLWYENTDVIGWPNAEAQPAEVDWALGSHARLRRATLAFAEGRRAEACLLGARLVAIWSRPEPAVAIAAGGLRAESAGCSR